MKKKFLYISFLSIILTSLTVFSISLFSRGKTVDEPNQIKINPNTSIPITPGKNPSDFSAVDNLLIALGVFEEQKSYQSNGYGEVRAAGTTQTLHDQAYYHDNGLIVSNISIGTFSKIIEQHYQNLKKDAFLVRNGKMPSSKNKAGDANWSTKSPRKFTRSDYNDAYGIKYQSYTPFILNKSTIIEASQRISGDKTIITASLTPEAASLYRRVIWTQGNLVEPPVYSLIKLIVTIDNNWVVSTTSTNTNYQVQVGIIKSTCISKLETTFTYDDVVCDYFTNYFSEYVKNLKDITKDDDINLINPGDVITKIFSNNQNLRISAKNNDTPICYLSYSPIVDSNGELLHLELIFDIQLMDVQAKVIVDQKDLDKSQIFIKANNNTIFEKIDFKDFTNLDSGIIDLIKLALQLADTKSFISNFNVTKTLDNNIILTNSIKGFTITFKTDLTCKLLSIELSNNILAAPFDNIEILPVVYKASYIDNNVTYSDNFSQAIQTFLTTKKFHVQNLNYTISDSVRLLLSDVAVDFGKNKLVINALLNYKDLKLQLSLVKHKDTFYLTVNQTLKVKTNVNGLLQILGNILPSDNLEKVKKILLFDFDFDSFLSFNSLPSTKINLLPICQFIDENFIKATPRIKINNIVDNQIFDYNSADYEDAKPLLTILSAILNDYYTYKNTNSLFKGFNFELCLNSFGNKNITGLINLDFNERNHYLVKINKIDNLDVDIEFSFDGENIILIKDNYLIKDKLVDLKTVVQRLITESNLMDKISIDSISTTFSQPEKVISKVLNNIEKFSTTTDSFTINFAKELLGKPLAITVDSSDNKLSNVTINYNNTELHLTTTDKKITQKDQTNLQVINLSSYLNKFLDNHTISFNSIAFSINNYNITLFNTLIDFNHKYLKTHVNIVINNFYVSFKVIVDQNYLYVEYNKNYYKFKLTDTISLLQNKLPHDLDFQMLLSFDIEKIVNYCINTFDFSKTNNSLPNIQLSGVSFPNSVNFDKNKYQDASNVLPLIKSLINEFNVSPIVIDKTFNFAIENNDFGELRLLGLVHITYKDNKLLIEGNINYFNHQPVNLYFSYDLETISVVHHNVKYSCHKTQISKLINQLSRSLNLDNHPLFNLLNNLQQNSTFNLISINDVLKSLDITTNKLGASFSLPRLNQDVNIDAYYNEDNLKLINIGALNNSLVFESTSNILTSPDVYQTVIFDDDIEHLINYGQIGLSGLLIEDDKYSILVRDLIVDFKTNFIECELSIKYLNFNVVIRVLVQDGFIYLTLHNQPQIKLSIQNAFSYFKQCGINLDNYEWLLSANLKTYFDNIKDNLQLLSSANHSPIKFVTSSLSVYVPSVQLYPSLITDCEELRVSQDNLEMITDLIKNKVLSLNLQGNAQINLNSTLYQAIYNINIIYNNSLSFQGEINLQTDQSHINCLISYDKTGLKLAVNDKAIAINKTALEKLTGSLYEVFSSNQEPIIDSNSFYLLKKLLNKEELLLNHVIVVIHVNHNNLTFKLANNNTLSLDLNDNLKVNAAFDSHSLSTAVNKNLEHFSEISNPTELSDSFVEMLLNLITNFKETLTTKQLSINSFIFNYQDMKVNTDIKADLNLQKIMVSGTFDSDKAIFDFSLIYDNGIIYITLFNQLKLMVTKQDLNDIIVILNRHISNDILNKLSTIDFNQTSHNFDYLKMIAEAVRILALQDETFNLINETLSNLNSCEILSTTVIPEINTESYSSFSDTLPIINKLLRIYKDGDFISLLNGNYRFSGTVKHERNHENEIVPGGYLLFDFDFTTAITYENSRYQFGATGFINDYTRKNKRYEIAVYLNDNLIYFQFDNFKTVVSVDQIHRVVAAISTSLNINHKVLDYLQEIDLNTFSTSLKTLLSGTMSGKLNLNDIFVSFSKTNLIFSTIINKTFIGGNQNQDLGVTSSFTSTNYLENLNITNLYTDSGEMLSFDYNLLDSTNQSATIPDSIKDQFIVYEEVDRLIITLINSYAKKNYHIIGSDNNSSFTIYVLGFVKITYTNIEIKIKLEEIVNSDGKKELEYSGYVKYKLHSPLTSGTATANYYNDVELFIKGQKVIMKRSYYKSLIWGSQYHEEKVYENFNENGEALANNLCDVLCLGPSVRSNMVSEMKDEPTHSQHERREIPPFDAFFKDYRCENNNFQTTLELTRITKNSKLGDMKLNIAVTDDNLIAGILITTKISSIVSLTDTGFKIISYECEVPPMPSI